ncbi:MAG: ADP-glyceromanno-heptose 6-epimerase [Betaproteobacteria bacterium]|nr:ADP-glyceromanno-heptose 6-epimerase [Betaproteobacteria bacterium]
MILVTGAAGFIGANLVKGLNAIGRTDILAVDNLTKADKFRNLADCDIADYWDKVDFLEAMAAGKFDGQFEVVYHNGACSDTMGGDGRYMMENNYRYSMSLLDWCQANGSRFIYASSAAVYGAGPVFREDRACERPLNVYGYSKFLADQVVRRRRPTLAGQVVGLRYFNVYGPREAHKGRMASVAFHCFNQFRAEGTVKLFEGSGGYSAGEQRRDFVSVEDVVRVNLWLLERPDVSGIFNLGTGRAQTFNEVASTAVNTLRRAEGKDPMTLADMQAHGVIEYVRFHEGLKDKYQSYTQADLAQLRDAGYEAPFLTVEQGVSRYVDWLLENMG